MDVAADGSGIVDVGFAIDDETLGFLPDYEHLLRLDDLRRAGWVVIAPVRENDGLTWVRASKPFAQADRLRAVLAEIDGPDGLFSEATVVIERTFAETTYEASVTVDLNRTFSDFADSELALLLDGTPFGVPTPVLEERAGRPLDETVAVEVALQIPEADEVRRRFSLADDEVVVVSSDSSIVDQSLIDDRGRASDNRRTAAYIAVGIGALVVLHALFRLVLWWVRRRRHKKVAVPPSNQDGEDAKSDDEVPVRDV